MGIARGFAGLLLEESKENPFKGSVLQLGRQGVFLNSEKFSKIFSSLNIEVPIELTNVKDPLERINDEFFFSILGFDCVESCDYSDFQDATHIFDLNEPVPDYLHNKYELIVDGGTMEHVFHIPQLLSNIFKMLKPGGRIVHLSPTSNYVDHGFYMFSPTFFFDYYSSNNWHDLKGKIIQHSYRQDIDPWMVYEYSPGSLEDLSYGGFDKGQLTGFFFTACKGDETSENIIPQQGKYVQNHWKTGESQINYSNSSSNVQTTTVSFFKKLFSRTPFLYKISASLFRSLLQKNKMPKYLGKY